MKKIYTAILLLFLIIVTSNIVYAKSIDYAIKNYDVNIVVNENNVLDVTETLDVYFYRYNHGIFRTIPTKGLISRGNGEEDTFFATIKDVSINEKYSVSKLNDVNKSTKFQIGNEKETIIGDKEYIIKYKYDLSNKIFRNFDELYYNIIGTDWDADIERLTFSIEMPKSFDATKIGFTHGEKDSSQTDNVEYTVDGNKITGEYNEVLDPKNAFTVRIELPKGYFKTNIKFSVYQIVLIILMIIITICVIFLWFKYGKDKEVVETVEFYPPEGLNSLELALGYRGEVSSEDVTSLLIYLASKGYIKIENQLDNNYKIIKLKEYDKDNEAEKIFLEGLFRNGDVATKETLEERFYLYQDEIQYKTNRNRDKIFNVLSDKLKYITILLSFVVLILGSLALWHGNIEKNFDLRTAIVNSDSIDLLFFACITFIFVGTAILNFFLKYRKAICIVALFFIGMAAGLLNWLFSTGINEKIVFVSQSEIIVAIIGFILYLVVINFSKIMTSRTEYGNMILGKIRGFKNFLENARKEELEALVMENPTYFYDILPYTYVLGISNKWISKFKEIGIRPSPNFSVDDDFSTSIGNMSHTISSISKSMASRPVSTSSGSSSSSSSGGSSSHGSSGGGSSGGGSGGGGGGSW